MTLNCCKFKFSRNFALVGMFGRQQRLKNEDRATLSVKELLSNESTFQRCIDYVDIAGRLGDPKWGPI